MSGEKIIIIVSIGELQSGLHAFSHFFSNAYTFFLMTNLLS